MEVKIREKCPVCKGTCWKETSDGTGKKEFCGCKQGYVHSWVDVTEIPGILGRIPKEPGKPH